MNTKQLILQKASILFAQNGYESFSIRTLAESIPLAPSVLYHYFKDKDALLFEMFNTLNRELGKKRAALPSVTSASEMLKQRIIFQLDNAQEIVAVLKYFIAYRKNFPSFEGGYVPDKSSLHIEEVLQHGVTTGEFTTNDLKKDAKVITHAINGFLLEYFPDTPSGKAKEELVTTIHEFLLRALMKGGEKNESA